MKDYLEIELEQMRILTLYSQAGVMHSTSLYSIKHAILSTKDFLSFATYNLNKYAPHLI
jgi:hypothetical protein